MIIKDKNVVMVIFAYNPTNINIPWIYGIYTDHIVGKEIQDTMQSSEEYGHLCWTNNLVELK